MEEVYKALREHLDSLPGGFPPTDSGVELRILKRLFSPEQAELARHLITRPEPAARIAERAAMREEDIAPLLEEMARKGLIFSIENGERPPAYMAAQFVVGIWEYHVNDLDEDFVKDMDEYMPVLAREAFDPVPPLRTIPVGRSIDSEIEILPHEMAEDLVRQQNKFLVAPCICRREHQIKGDGCDKLMEACLVFGWGADYYERNGLGRIITLEETLEILRKADQEGLVLQPGNTREIVNICCCCGDCCQILINLKRHPAPAAMASASFVARIDPEICIACETCLDRCQMEALHMEDEHAVLNKDRCIGCGLCVSTCPSGALTLERKPQEEQPEIPRNQMEAFTLRLKAREQVKAGLKDKLARHGKI
ncbi:MAG: 4Fe-4S binding protein [Deltaproteobacteria bacterium]|nr:4Fe-4S binding protein [Deltaproteobacteria bacterium]MBW2047791.1 4Fe-4S binding protein [Deltaproteobacteria bacterium]MBW2112115.1 4Fe-4S binding protein [Deltaproteobacteria bacterium]MBW2352400.1 4Fe-4S binding protein [Deltaproteobacteria bacterium]HDZ89790.1 4Fe-4S dicluster domain-containing protein [Deltaproteobacteria bacterium]